jgi:hypothetical protein
MTDVKKWRVVVTIDASSTETVEAATKEEAEEKAMVLASGHGLCHHCSDHIALGDVLEAVECLEADK